MATGSGPASGTGPRPLVGPFSRRPQFWATPPAVIAQTASDTALATDSLAVIQALGQTASDSTLASDAATRATEVFTRTGADAATATDATARAAQALIRTTTDTTFAAEVAIRTAPLSRTTSDTANAVDVATRGSQALARTSADAALAADAATRSFSLSRASSDAAAASDTAARTAQALTRSGADSVLASDTASRAGSSVRTGADSTLADDNVVSSPIDPRSASDAAAATDAAVRQAQSFPRTASDSELAMDLATRFLAVVPTAADSSTATDSAIRAVETFTRTSSDAASVADAVAQSLVFTRSVADGSTAVDLVTFVWMFSRAGSDNAVATDSTTRQAQSSRSGSDAASSTDTVTRSLQITRVASDSMLASDEPPVPSFVNATTGATPGASGGTSFTIAAPSGLQVGDLMVLAVSNTPTISSITGGGGAWTSQVAEVTGGGVFQSGSGFIYQSHASLRSRVATAGDIGATFTVNVNVGGSAGISTGVIAAYRSTSGVDLHTSSTSSAQTYAGPTGTAGSANERVIHAVGIEVLPGVTAPTVTIGGGYVQRAQLGTTSTNGSPSRTIVLADYLQSATGTTTAASDTDGSVDAEYIGFLLSLKPGVGITSQVFLPRTGSDSLGATDSAHVVAQPSHASDSAAATDATARIETATRTVADIATSSDERATITDDFNRTNNSSSLGSATTGQTWIVPSGHGTWGVVSNKGAQIVTASGFATGGQCVAVVDAGIASVDMSITMTVGSPFNPGDPNSRDISPGMSFAWNAASGGSGYIVTKNTLTGIISLTQLTLNGGKNSLGSVNGSGGGTWSARVTYNQTSGIIKVYESGTLVLTATAATKYAGTQHGLTVQTFNAQTSTATFDNLSIAPLIPGVPRILVTTRTASDAASATDTAARSASSLARTGSDSAAATDLVTRSISFSRTASDSALATNETTLGVTDNFNRVNSNLDGTTTSDGTKVWSRLTTGSFASSSGVLTISSNEIIHGGGLGSFLAGDVVPCQSSDGTVSITVTATATGSAAVGLIGRWEAATGHCYRAFFKSGNYNIVEDKGFSNGLAFVAGTLSAGDVLSLVMSGSSLILKNNGVTVASGTATITIASSTHGALLLDNGTAAQHFDSFSFTTTSPSNTRVVVHPRTGSDTSSAADTATRIDKNSAVATDALGSTDTATRLLVASHSSSDSATATDAATRTWGTARTAGDTAASNDVTNRIEPLARTVNDTTGSIDAATRVLLLTRTASDSEVSGDVATASGRGSQSGSASDSGPATDTVTRTSRFSRVLAESVNALDVAARASLAFARAATDSTLMADAVTRSLAVIRNVDETAIAQDVASLVTAFARAITDPASVTDILARITAFARSVSAVALASDAVARIAKIFTRAVDSAMVSDAVQAVVAFTRRITESSPASDTATRRTSLVRAGSDGASLLDSASVLARAHRFSADQALAADSITNLFHSRSAIDVAAAEDQARRQLTALLAANDTALAGDTAVHSPVFNTIFHIYWWNPVALAWQKKPLKVWIDNQWQDRPLRRWNPIFGTWDVVPT